MNQTQRRRAEAEVRLYNTDGRFYEIDEVPGVLEVRLDTGAVSSGQLWIPTLFSVCGGYVGLFVIQAWIPMTMPFWSKILVVALWAWVAEYVFGFLSRRRFGSPHSTCWMFDRLNNQLLADKNSIALLSDIVAVEAFKKWRRLFVDVCLRDGRRVRLGLFGFASKEWAWRQDASAIAAFLDVPLLIPKP